MISPLTIETARLQLVAKTRDEALASLARMSPEDRAQVSPDWMVKLNASSACDPWVHGFEARLRITGEAIGQCGFKGPPGAEGVAEIAYGIEPAHRGQGYATEAAGALVAFAFNDGSVSVVRAHTLPEANASGRVLGKCGFRKIGEVVDPEDGPVWRWEIDRTRVASL